MLKTVVVAAAVVVVAVAVATATVARRSIVIWTSLLRLNYYKRSHHHIPQQVESSVAPRSCRCSFQ